MKQTTCNIIIFSILALIFVPNALAFGPGGPTDIYYVPPKEPILLKQALPQTSTTTQSTQESSSLSTLVRSDVDTPITKKVLVIDFNPIIESANGQRLRQFKEWQDPTNLENQYIAAVKEATSGYLTYQIVQRLADIDAYPAKNNGYVFTDESYLAASLSPDANARAIIDYQKLLVDYGVCEKINSGQIHEVWLWGGPWFGYWEAIMAGPGAISTNASPIHTTSCQQQLDIMGFSYERDVGSMLENLGHRLEGVMKVVYGEDPRWTKNVITLWGKFGLSDQLSPGNAGCGWMHRAPNSSAAYVYWDTVSVLSSCEDWLNYPHLTGQIEHIDCSRWNCNGTEFKKWWFSHVPKYTGVTNDKWNNWWKYMVAYQTAMLPIIFPTGDFTKDALVTWGDIAQVIGFFVLTKNAAATTPHYDIFDYNAVVENYGRSN